MIHLRFFRCGHSEGTYYYPYPNTSTYCICIRKIPFGYVSNVIYWFPEDMVWNFNHEEPSSFGTLGFQYFCTRRCAKLGLWSDQKSEFYRTLVRHKVWVLWDRKSGSRPTGVSNMHSGLKHCNYLPLKHDMRRHIIKTLHIKFNHIIECCLWSLKCTTHFKKPMSEHNPVSHRYSEQ